MWFDLARLTGEECSAWPNLFGEDRTPTNDRQKRFVNCYASEDLVHWRFRHSVLQLADPAGLGEGWVLERISV